MAKNRQKKAILWAAATAAMLMCAMGCERAAIKANEEQVKAQQQQIEELQKEIAAIKAQRSYPSGGTPAGSPGSYPAVAPGTPGSCDRNVMRLATRRGGQAFSSGNMTRALDYYRDALTACPGDTEAALNLARTYEALGKREQAIVYYRQAATSTTGNPKDAKSARVALQRLGASP